MMQTEHIIILSVVSVTLLAAIAVIVMQWINLQRLSDVGNDQKDVKQKVDYANDVLVRIQTKLKTMFQPVV